MSDPTTTGIPGTTTRTVAGGDVELHVVEAGEGFPVLLAHGFPELSYSWRHQVPALAGAGYRVIAPDQRGYGRSGRPPAVEDYDIEALTGDLLAVLDALGEERAVVVGHDWGSMVAWSLAQLHPERVAGVVGMSVPFIPRGPMPPIQMLRQAFAGAFFYMIYFQEPGVADAELGADPARTMRRLLAGGAMQSDLGDAGDAGEGAAAFLADDGRGFVERLPEPDGLPGWLTRAELDHYVAEFTRTGFTGGLNWYRNLDRNWELTEQLAGKGVDVPSLFIGGTRDPVLTFMPPGVMENLLADHRGSIMVEDAGHWVQQEAPTQVNQALLTFLTDLGLES